MRQQLLSFALLLLNLAALDTRVSAQAVLRRPSPKVVPTGEPRGWTQPTGVAVRRIPSPKAVAKSKPSKSTSKGKKALKRPPPPRKQVILPHGRSHVKFDKKRRRHRHGRISMPRDMLLNETDEMDVQLFDVLPVRKYKRKPTPRQSSHEKAISFYYGESDENSSHRINLVQTKTSDGESMLAGSVHENGFVYQIRQLPDGEIVVKSTKTKDFQPERHHEGPVLQNRIAMPKDEVEGVQFATNSTTGRRLSEDGSVLDVMVIYTNNAMCAAASQPYGCQATPSNQGVMEALINLAVQETNVAYSNSDIPTQLRLVHIHYEANYDDHANDWQTTLNSVQDPHDGNFDYIPAMRAQYGADFVSTIVDSGQYCGLSYLPNPPTADQAFSLVLWSCATGYYSFGHELGHNMGCNHDRPDAGSAGQSGTGYNFGYQYENGQSTNQNFRTILSYDCPGGCERLQRFSNPSKVYQGLSLGSSTTNNARWISERLSIYANFMPAVINPSPGTSTANAAVRPAISQLVTTASFGTSTGNDSFLATSFAGGLVGVAGNIFSVVAKNDITVTNFAVHSYAATTVNVEVWTRTTPGGCKGAQRSRNGWVQIGVASFVASASGQASELPLGTIEPVPIKAGDEQCFYVTFGGITNYNRYSHGRRFGRTFTSNNDLRITEGYAVGYQFGDSLAPRVFNGEVFYKSGISSAAAPTAAPTGVARSFKSPALSSSLNAVATTFDGGSGQAGNMFDIKASTTLTVRSLDLNTMSRSIQTVRVYTKKGSLVGSEYNSSAWTLISSTRVHGMGSSNPTNIPEKALRPVVIEAGDVQAFYVTFTKATIRYTSGDVTTKNSDLQFLRSVGNKFSFGDVYPQRIWNGKLFYSTGAAADSAAGYGTAGEGAGVFKSQLINDHELFGNSEKIANGVIVRDGDS